MPKWPSSTYGWIGHQKLSVAPVGSRRITKQQLKRTTKINQTNKLPMEGPPGRSFHRLKTCRPEAAWIRRTMVTFTDKLKGLLFLNSIKIRQPPFWMPGWNLFRGLVYSHQSEFLIKEINEANPLSQLPLVYHRDEILSGADQILNTVTAMS